MWFWRYLGHQTAVGGSVAFQGLLAFPDCFWDRAAVVIFLRLHVCVLFIFESGPGKHQGGWWFSIAQCSIQGGGRLYFVQLLKSFVAREALDTIPDMMVFCCCLIRQIFKI